MVPTLENERTYCLQKIRNRMEFVFDNKNTMQTTYIPTKFLMLMFEKSEKYNLDPSFKIYKRYIVDDLIIYEVYKKD